MIKETMNTVNSSHPTIDFHHIDYVMGLALPDDVASELAPNYEFAAMLANTGKPILAWAYSAENLVDIVRLAAAAVGSEEAFYQRPILAHFTTSLAPLTHTDAEVANALWCAERGIPIVYLGGGTAGVSAPVTGAGTLVISPAAVLSGLAMIQLKNPGAVPAPMDPRTCRPSYGAPEMSLYSETARLFRQEIWLPGLLDRTPWALWEVAGRPTMHGAIKTRLQRILQTHVPPPLPDGAAAEIEAILRQAEERLKSGTRTG